MRSLIKAAVTATLLAAAVLVFTQTAHADAVVIRLVDSAGNVGSYTSLELNAAGNPVISYKDNDNMNLKLAVCSTPACTNPTLTTVDAAEDVGDFSALVLGGGDVPIIGYQDNANQDLRLAVCNDATCTSPTIRVLDSAGFVGGYTDIVLDATGSPMVVYTDITNLELKLAVCDNPTCSTWNIYTIGSGGNFGIYPSIQLNAAGNPIISYSEEIFDFALTLAICDDPTCGSVTFTIVDAVDLVGRGSSLQLDASGSPVISYHDRTNLTTKLAYCDNLTCANPTITVVDTTTSSFDKTALVLSEDGNPMVAYRDAFNGDLKLAVCATPTCETPTVTVLDSTDDVGRAPSMHLDARGVPVISYYDSTNGDLKLYREIGVDNPGFEGALGGAWSVLGDDGRFQSGQAFEGSYLLLFNASGTTELVTQTLPVPGSSGADYTVSYQIGAQNLPPGGEIGARVEFLSGGAVVSVTECFVTDRGTFTWQQQVCAAAATADFDSIRIRLGLRGSIDSGRVGFDIVDITGPN